jgi:LysM repeat protein
MQYGLEITPVVEPMTDVVRLTAPADLRRIAEWIDVPVQVLQDLNPELRRWPTPVRMTDYDLTVPMGKAEVLSARLAEASPHDLAPLNRYSVRKGETITTIARKLKVKRADLAQANYLSERARLAAGQQLIIPRAPTLLLAAGDRPTRADAAARDAMSGAAVHVRSRWPTPAFARRRTGSCTGEERRAVPDRRSNTRSRRQSTFRGRIKIGQRLTINVPRGVQPTNSSPETRSAASSAALGANPAPHFSIRKETTGDAVTAGHVAERSNACSPPAQRRVRGQASRRRRSGRVVWPPLSTCSPSDTTVREPRPCAAIKNRADSLSTASQNQAPASAGRLVDPPIARPDRHLRFGDASGHRRHARPKRALNGGINGIRGVLPIAARPGLGSASSAAAERRRGV